MLDGDSQNPHRFVLTVINQASLWLAVFCLNPAQ